MKTPSVRATGVAAFAPGTAPGSDSRHPAAKFDLRARTAGAGGGRTGRPPPPLPTYSAGQDLAARPGRARSIADGQQLPEDGTHIGLDCQWAQPTRRRRIPDRATLR